jgi:hypothetical protein
MVANNGVYASGEKSLYQLVQFISKAPSSVQKNTSPASFMILDVSLCRLCALSSRGRDHEVYSRGRSLCAGAHKMEKLTE